MFDWGRKAATNKRMTTRSNSGGLSIDDEHGAHNKHVHLHCVTFIGC